MLASLVGRLSRSLAAARQWAVQRPWSFAARFGAWLWLLIIVLTVVAPWWERTDTYGFHDWDVITSFRYLTKVSLLQHGEFPGYNPYACGGYPLWGYVEGGTNLVSPWLLAYLALPISLALRVEVLGMALLGAAGAYRLTSGFTRSRAAALMVAALWAVNGRWGLQIAAGHAWHLSYALLPWCLHFYERWRQPEARARNLLGLSGAFAWMVYAGGIYPLPHSVLALGLYALLLTLSLRSLRPLWSLATAGIAALGLAAPKLLPMADTFSSDPRLIDSTEKLDLGAFFTLLTHPDQSFGSRPASVRPYGWHEWGMYIGVGGLMLLILGLWQLRDKRARLLAAVGGVFVLLGFGAFHPAAPWTLLHRYAPVFRSQHVPSRFLYPALLLLAVAAATGWGRTIERRLRRAPWLDAAALLLVALVGLDIAGVAQLPMRQSMWMEAPNIPAGRSFQQHKQPPFQYKKRDWAGPMLLSMMANAGVLNCYGVPRDPAQPIAPLPLNHPRYRGEAYVVGGGSAQVLQRTPNSVEVATRDVAAGATLVLNMQFRRGWHIERAGETSAANAHQRLLATPAYNGRIRFYYRPPGLVWGLVWFFATLIGMALWWRRRGGERWRSAA